MDSHALAWLNHKLYHNEIGESRAWTTAVAYTVSRVDIMKKYEGSQGMRHTTVGLAWRRHHIFILNSDGCEGPHWFVCATDRRVPVWVIKVWIWEPLPSTSLVRPRLKPLQQKGVSTHAWA